MTCHLFVFSCSHISESNLSCCTSFPMLSFCAAMVLLKGHTGGWPLFFFAALIPVCVKFYPAAAPKPPESTGFHLQRNESNSDTQIYHPVLQPTETIPTPGTYTVEDLVGRTCIKVTMGAEYIVIEKQKNLHFNLEPSVVRILGHCGKEEARLSLTLPDNSASLQFTFRTEQQTFYVSELTAHLFLHPACNGCPNRTYSGSMTHVELFKTDNDQSFKCQSEYLLSVSSELRIKLVPLQIQAFSIPSARYGKENECWADFKERLIPIITGSVVVGLILCVLLSFLFIRDHQGGYERL